MRKKKQQAPAGAPEWMTTYSDMVTLLLTFFILMFSFSSVDAQKFETMMRSFQGSLGILEGGKTLSELPLATNGADIDVESDGIYEHLSQEIEDYLNQNGLGESVNIINGNNGLILRFNENVLFDSGKADLKPQAMATLSYICSLLNASDFSGKKIRVEGHTDNVPIYNSKYPSNWELSVSRACNVVRFMIEQNGVMSERLSAAGYSEYHPVAANDTVDNKAKNRRVDILILKDGLQ
ncbi:MAG: OmpA family protein [Peptoclostridium sp.]|uniref:flagellar motor protein MotB n=1 Tax=Peptoclostridium sp. TaxID=1904860 RepID=UPI00139DCA09|nr:flagellar motor protein MotB [Peptoclostridium sp.]MZQ75130.1 OmpA family protein [Peptoclostridium sp.]